MEIEMQMTSVPLDFLSGSFPPCKLVENCFEPIRRRLRAVRSGVRVCRCSRGPLPGRVGAAWRCSFLRCGRVAEPPDLSMAPWAGVRFLCVLAFGCVRVHQNPCEVPVVLSAKLFGEGRKKKRRRGDD